MAKKDGRFKKGNKAAEKYPEDKVIEILERMIEFSQQEEVESIVVSRTKGGNSLKETSKVVRKVVHLKKELLINEKIWNPDWFNQMRTKFKNSNSVSSLLNALDMICEVNSYKTASEGLGDTTIIKMNLAHHYGWKDKTENEQNIKVSPSIDLSKLTDDELRKYLELSTKCRGDQSGVI
jgi:hypothetical protein